MHFLELVTRMKEGYYDWEIAVDVQAYQIIKKERDQTMALQERVFKISKVIFSYHTKSFADKVSSNLNS